MFKLCGKSSVHLILSLSLSHILTRSFSFGASVSIFNKRWLMISRLAEPTAWHCRTLDMNTVLLDFTEGKSL